MTWKDSLPKKPRESLESLLLDAEQYESSYMDSENPTVGQIWVVMALMNQRLQKTEQLVRAQRKALKEMDIEIEVDKHLDEDLKESLKRY